MTKPLPDQEVADIRTRLEQCVAGPWIHRGDGFIETQDRRVIGVTCAGGGDCGGADQLPRAAHAQFLAAAREDIPRLLDEVDRLRAEVARLQGDSVAEPRRIDLIPPPKMPIHLGVR